MQYGDVGVELCVRLGILSLTSLQRNTQWNHYDKDHAHIRHRDVSKRNLARLRWLFIRPNSWLKTEKPKVEHLS